MTDDAATPDATTATASPPDASPDRPTRSSALALARLHLRTGALALARTELETMAGRDLLDDAGILDLAEVRWRTGDVTGAGEAVAVLLEGTDGAVDADDDRPPLAVIIAAEAAAARGRPTESRRLAERLRSSDRASIDALFAGLPRSSAWPADPLALAPTSATLFPTGPGPTAGAAAARGGVGDGRSEVPPAASTAALDPARSPGFWDAPSGADDAGDAGADDGPEIDPELAAVAEAIALTEATAEHAAASTSRGELDGEAGLDEDVEADDDADLDGPDPAAMLDDGRAALVDRDLPTAALHLGLALRLAPTLAPAVLDALAAADEATADDPGLAFVRGDAYRLVGRERDARRAYARARPSIPTQPDPSDADPPPAIDDRVDGEP